MDSHYTELDRQRLAPKLRTVINAMVGRGWIRLEDVSKETGIKLGTVASRLREACDVDHAYLGLDKARRCVAPGVHEYMLFIRQPEQLPLLEAVHA